MTTRTLSNLLSWLCCAVVAMALAACQGPEADADASRPASESSRTVQPQPAAPPATDTAPATHAGPPRLSVTLLDGQTFDLAAHRGRWVVVNFWATWCAPCLKEMPELSALDAMREHVEVIGLAYEDIEPAALKAFLQQHPVVYPVAVVDLYDPPEDFATPRGLPMTYLIAPDGRIARQFMGPVTAKAIDEAIAAGGGPAPGDG